jgi:hypothetical protein
MRRRRRETKPFVMGSSFPVREHRPKRESFHLYAELNALGYRDDAISLSAATMPDATRRALES